MSSENKNKGFGTAPVFFTAISTIFGAMSAKVNTVVDFFFGGSAKRD